MKGGEFVRKHFSDISDSKALERTVENKISENAAIRSLADDALADKILSAIEHELARLLKKETSESNQQLQKAQPRFDVFLDHLSTVLANPRNLELFSKQTIDSAVLQLQNEDGSENTRTITALCNSLHSVETQDARRTGNLQEYFRLACLREVDVVQAYKDKLPSYAEDQRQSLQEWFDYFSSLDGDRYPFWFKLYAIRSLLSMGLINKEERSFTNRETDDKNPLLRPFPELNQKAVKLAYTMIDARLKDDREMGRANTHQHEAWEKALTGGKFARIYAQALMETTKNEQAEPTDGEWRRYQQGNAGESERLLNELKGWGTGWGSAAGKTGANNYLRRGDMEIFFTRNREGQFHVPRVAIAMKGTGPEARVLQMRGTSVHQDIDDELTEIAIEHLGDRPGSEMLGEFIDNVAQYKRIREKIAAGAFDTQDRDQLRKDLRFIWEVDRPYVGFGINVQGGPAIKELQSLRNKDADMPLALRCTPADIAHSKEDRIRLRDKCKAYVGPLYPDFFRKLSKSIEHVYLEFPDRQIRIKIFDFTRQTADQLLESIRSRGMHILPRTENILRQISPGQTRSVRFAFVQPADLGLDSNARKKDMYDIDSGGHFLGAAATHGLLPLTADVGPQLRVQYTDQPLGERLSIGMRPLRLSNEQIVFMVNREGYLCWLDLGDGRPDSRIGHELLWTAFAIPD